MIRVEQLHATSLRMAEETAVGSGEASGLWITPPTTAAAVSRDFVQTAERLDVFRQLAERKVISQAWLIRSSHEVGMAFFKWLMLPHMVSRGGGIYTLDPEAEGPTFTLEAETEQGHRSKFSGMKLAEIQLIFEEGRVIRLDCQWEALQRTTPATDLPVADLAPTGALMATYRAVAALSLGAWDASPEITQRVPGYGAQLFFQRNIAATDYGPDGVPSSHTRAAWKVLGEIYLPEIAGITDTAFGNEWRGKAGLWFGGGETANLRCNNVVGYVTDDDLKGYDVRVRRLVFEGVSDDRRSVLDFRA